MNKKLKGIINYNLIYFLYIYYIFNFLYNLIRCTKHNHNIVSQTIIVSYVLYSKFEVCTLFFFFFFKSLTCIRVTRSNRLRKSFFIIGSVNHIIFVYIQRFWVMRLMKQRASSMHSKDCYLDGKTIKRFFVNFNV